MDIPMPPRQVPLKVKTRLILGNMGAGSSFPILMLLIMVIMPFVFIAVFLSLVDDAPDYSTINDKGIQLQATVVSIKSDPHTKINDVHPLVVIYNYRKDGVSYQDHVSTLDFGRAQAIKPGSRIQIKYYKGDTIIPGLEPASFPFWIFILLPIVMLIVLACIMGFMIWRGIGKIRLYREGNVHEGRVVAIEEARSMPFFTPFALRSKEYAVTYSYRDESQTERVGKSNSRDITLAKSLGKGDTVRILVMPYQPSCSILIDDALMAEIAAL